MYRSKQDKLIRIYINNDIYQGLSLELCENNFHYIVNVMRLNIGNEIRIFNGKSGEFLAKIEYFSKKTVSIIVLNKIREQVNIKQKITLVFAPIKNNRMEFLIEKATELGVDEFIPVKTNRTIIDKLNIHKYQNIIIEACEQSERLTVPTISNIVKLQDFINNFDKTNILLFANEHKNYEVSLFYQLNQINTGDKLFILVGPEGGFSEEEVKYLEQKEFVRSISLGENILRAETASIKILSCLK